MTTKMVINLLLVLVLGIGLIVGKQLWEKYQNTRPNAYLNAVQAIRLEDINELSIAQGDKKLSFIYSDDEWKLATLSANTRKVVDFIQAFFPTTSPTLIAESEAQRQKLGMVAKDAVQVALKNKSNELISFTVGKPSGNTPVSIANEPQTYSIAGIGAISLQAKDWYNLNVLDLESEAVKKVTFTQGAVSFTLSHDTDTWKVDKSENSVDQAVVNSWLMKINPLVAKELAFEANKKNYNTFVPAFSLEITTDSQEVNTLVFYRGLKDYLVERSPNNQAFILSDTDAQQLMKSEQDFIAATTKP